MNIKKIGVSISKVMLFSIIITLFIALAQTIYYLGYIKGLSIVEMKADDDLASSLEITGKPTNAPSPTPKPVVLRQTQTTTTPTSTSYGYHVTWGGPELWEAVNKRRQEFGVNPLNLREDLCTIASIRLNQLIELGKLDGHIGFTNMSTERPDLKWIFDKYGAIAEFLAVGGKTPEETVSLWENTLGHRQLLSGGEYVWGCIYSQNTFAVAIAAY